MARLKIPLLSFDAKKSIGKALTFTRRHGKTIAEAKPEPFDPRATLQLDWRHMFLKVVALWNALTASEKQEWESLARRHHLTGYQWFVSQALRPNPGIYLPLQGGKMSGNIDMDGNRILKLPLPLVDQEAATKKYHDDNLPAGGTREIYVPATHGTRMLERATFPGVECNAVDEFASLSFRVPHDFTSLTTALLILDPLATVANANWDIYSTYAHCDETYNLHTESDVASTYNVTLNKQYCLDLSGILTGIAVGDLVGIYFVQKSIGHNAFVFGASIRYQ